MTTDLEERLLAYRQPLEEAIDAHRYQPTGDHRRWSLLAPLVGTLVASTIAVFMIAVRVDDDPTAPADTGQMPPPPATPRFLRSKRRSRPSQCRKQRATQPSPLSRTLRPQRPRRQLWRLVTL